MELMRDGEGIHARWKQYVTDEDWSRYVLLAPIENLDTIASLHPPNIEHEFGGKESTDHMNFIKHLGRTLQAQGSYEMHESGLEWLESIATNRWGYTGVDFKEMLRFGLNSPGSDVVQPLGIPDDVLISVAPGADIQAQPVDSLITVDGCPPEEHCRGGRNPYVTPGDWVVVRGSSLPFFVGALMDWDGEKGYVRWLHPMESDQELFRAGRKKKIIDVFGSWQWADEMAVNLLQTLPNAKWLGLASGVCVCVCVFDCRNLDLSLVLKLLITSKGPSSRHPRVGLRYGGP